MVEFTAVSTFFSFGWVRSLGVRPFFTTILQVFVFALALTKSIFVSSCCSSTYRDVTWAIVGGRGVYSYVGVMPVGFLLRSIQIQKKSVGQNINIWINTPSPISVLVTSLHTYLPQYAVLPHCYVPTDVPLLGYPEVSFLVHAMLVFVSDLMCHTELFVAWFQSRRLQSCSVWSVFIVACSTGQAYLHFLAWVAEIDKRRTNNVFVVRNVRLRICRFIEVVIVSIFRYMPKHFSNLRTCLI